MVFGTYSLCIRALLLRSSTSGHCLMFGTTPLVDCAAILGAQRPHKPPQDHINIRIALVEYVKYYTSMVYYSMVCYGMVYQSMV